MTKDRRQNFPAARRGSALGVIMLFLGSFVILGAAAYKLLSSEIVSSVYQTRKTAAFYIAEAGMQDALQVLTDSSTWNSWSVGFTTKTFAAGFYTVTVSTLALPVTITSVGETRGRFPSDTTGKAAITVKITTNPGIFGYVAGALGHPGNKGLTITNSSISGDTYEAATAAPPLPEPVINGAALKAEAQNGGGCPNGNVNINGVTATLGPRCINNGNLTITNSTITLTGTVYIDKDLTISNSSVVGMRTIYAGGNVSIINASTIGSAAPNSSPFIYTPVTGNSARVGIEDSFVYNTGIYAPNARLDLINSTASGSFIAGNSEYTNAAKPGIVGSTMTWAPVYYPGGLGEGALTVIPGSWDEAY